VIGASPTASLAEASAPARAADGAGPAPLAFGNPRPFLARYLKARGVSDATLCVVGYDSAKTKYPFAEVYWKEQETMILWEGTELSASRRILAHARDVVATPADLHGSTFLVTEGWWSRTTSDCARFGTTYTFHAARPRAAKR